MTALGDPGRHFALLNGMARAAGANLSDALRCGALDGSSFAGMMTGCRACAGADACQAFLGAAAEGADRSIPDWCVNAAILGALAAVVPHH